MTARVIWCGCVLVSMATCATLAHAEVAAQGEPSGATPAPLGGDPESSARVRVTLEGFVLGPDGSPAEGAVVMSNAGGKAVTDVAGNYRLEVEVPLEATSVQVTASGGVGGNLVASASVVLRASTGATRVDPLALSLGSSCTPKWIPTFGGPFGADFAVKAIAVFDDGGGQALFAGGGFTLGGGGGGVVANRIAKWDGSSWAPLGSGIADSFTSVADLAVYDDGSGPALYVGGVFTSAGGVAANGIAKWDGSSWSPLGSGVSGTSSGVFALTVFDDGSGLALYAGGQFTSAGGVPANHIAKWNGSSWSALGSGVSGGPVLALTVFDDGSGPALYAGGLFTRADGWPARRIAKWNGSSWSGLQNPLNRDVFALTVFDDGGGPALYAGGEFTTAGGAPANRIAKWDGSSWSALGSGMNFPFGYTAVNALAVYEDGSGPALYAGGSFTTAGGVSANGIAKWNGQSWTALGSGMDGDFISYYGTVHALAVHDDGGGPALYAGGDFSSAGDVGAKWIARWIGSTWSAVGNGQNNHVSALAVYDDGSGTALYAGGHAIAGGVAANGIAKWDDSSWAPLASDVDGLVEVLAVHDDGGGPALFAGGTFSTVGAVAANGIARWDGSSWTALGGGMDGAVFALAVHDDGGGPALFAGGTFSTAGSVAANRVAKWNGSSWTALGGGMNDDVRALVSHDDGGGPALYAGGGFTTAGGVAANRIARWDGSSWTALGGGMYDDVRALVSHDDGGGTALYAGGGFATAGGEVASHIARWDGSNWSALGSGITGTVFALSVFDDGGGPALYAGGQFIFAGGLGPNRIAKWDGSSWSALGSGTNDEVLALAVHDDGGGPALYAGGRFTVAFDSGDSLIAKWGCPFPVTVSPRARRR